MDVKQYTKDEIVEITNNYGNQIGQGGFATIFKGTINRGEHHEQTVAVKVYDMLKASETQRKQFRAELVSLSQFKHENIVKLIGYAQCEDANAKTLMIVLEYIATPLLRVIDNLDWQDTLRILRQTASALQYIHGYGDGKYILMDFKTENIMIDEANKAKIVDFGSILKQGSYVITYSNDYAAPEVMRPVRAPTQKADVYSFGVVMLQIMMKFQDVKPDNKGESSSRRGGSSIKELRAHITEAARIQFRLGGHYVNKILLGDGNKCSTDTAKQITILALACTEKAHNARPTMAEVITKLNEF